MANKEAQEALGITDKQVEQHRRIMVNHIMLGQWVEGDPIFTSYLMPSTTVKVEELVCMWLGFEQQGDPKAVPTDAATLQQTNYTATQLQYAAGLLDETRNRADIIRCDAARVMAKTAVPMAASALGQTTDEVISAVKSGMSASTMLNTFRPDLNMPGLGGSKKGGSEVN